MLACGALMHKPNGFHPAIRLDMRSPILFGTFILKHLTFIPQPSFRRADRKRGTIVDSRDVEKWKLVISYLQCRKANKIAPKMPPNLYIVRVYKKALEYEDLAILSEFNNHPQHASKVP
jgi:hypothetical protein